MVVAPLSLKPTARWRRCSAVGFGGWKGHPTLTFYNHYIISIISGFIFSCHFHPYLGKWSKIWRNMFQMGCNYQLDWIWYSTEKNQWCPLKNDGWKTILSFWNWLSSVGHVSFQGCTDFGCGLITVNHYPIKGPCLFRGLVDDKLARYMGFIS